MYRVSERHPNLRPASAAATLIVLASVAAPIDFDAQTASPPIATQTPSVRAASIAGPTANKSVSDGEIEPEVARFAQLPASQPHVLDGAVADVIVRLQGGLCSGTPITGTVYVVTAAHCVLTNSGEVRRRTIVRDDITYTAVGVIVDTDYHDHPSAELDAAVLIMAQVVPGPSARVGSSLPDSGQVTLAGYQPIDSDGTLLRGHGPNDHPLPKDGSGPRTDLPFRPAGCVESVQSLALSAAPLMVPCGLVPGASGGGLFTEDNGELVLVGILSTVTDDLSANGIVPLNSLHGLLKHPERHTHAFTTGHVHGDHSRSPDTTEASGPARRHVEPRSYRAFHGSADTLEHWIEAEITRCIQDARTSDVPRTADAIDRELANIRATCTSQVVAPDRD